MKSRFLAALAVISLTGGCLAPRNDGRPGLIRGLYNRIHGNDVGAPCASGGCAPGYLPAPPAMAPAMVPAMAPGCNGCGETMAQYPGYAMDDGFRGANFGGQPYGSEVYGGEIYDGAVVNPGMIGGGVQVAPGVQVSPEAVYGNGT